MEINILNAINSLHTPVLDKIMVFLSTIGNHGLVWIAAALALLVFRRRRKYCPYVIVALLTDLLVVDVCLKHLVHRARPFIGTDMAARLLIPVPADFSFPSGHTASAFAAVTILFFADKRLGLAGLLLALLIAFSRLYLYVHYPTDILGGAIAGVLCGLLAKWLCDKIVSLRSNRP